MSPAPAAPRIGVGERVRGGVAVGMSLEVHVARNGNAAEDERSRRREAVRVVADADAGSGKRDAGSGTLGLRHAAAIPGRALPRSRPAPPGTSSPAADARR